MKPRKLGGLVVNYYSGCFLALLLIAHLIKADDYEEDPASSSDYQEKAGVTQLPPDIAQHDVPSLFRADPYYYINKRGNCPGNFMPSVSVEGLAVDNLETCLKKCSMQPACKSAAVRMRDLPALDPNQNNGATLRDNVTRCWLKTVDQCPRTFLPVGRNVEATMLVKTPQRPMTASLVHSAANPGLNSTANCTIEGLPPPIASTISIEVSTFDDQSQPIWLGPLNITQLNMTAFSAVANVPPMARGTAMRLNCFAANPIGASVHRNVEIRALTLPYFASLKMFFDEITNSSARIRWSRWNSSGTDFGAGPVIGYKIFVQPLDDGESTIVQPSNYVTEELLNSTFQAVIDERTCGTRSNSCQFRLRDLDPQSRYLVGVMSIRPGKGGDNGTINWSLAPLITLCGRPGPIETLTTSIRWRRGMPQIVAVFEPPKRSANCPEPGEFVVSYVELDGASKETRQVRVPGIRRQTEFNDVKTGQNYSVTVWYRNTEREEGDTLQSAIWTGIPIKMGVKSTSATTISLLWNISPSPSEFPLTFRIAFWKDNTVQDFEEDPELALMKFRAIDTNSSCQRGVTLLECSATIENLEPNTLHYFSVIAYGSTEEMYRSETLTVTTACNAPLPPVNMTVVRQTKLAITVQWDVFSDIRCPLAMSQLEVSNRQKQVVLNVSDPTSRQYSFGTAELLSWLSNSKLVSVKARSLNVRGLYSDWSEPEDMYILAAPSDASAERSTPIVARSSSRMPTTTSEEVEASSSEETSTLSVWSKITSSSSLSSSSSTSAEATSTLGLPVSEATYVSSTQTMIIGIVVGCGCVASAMAVLCILLLKKKKLLSRNKVSRFNIPPATGDLQPPQSGAAAPHDYFIKQHSNLSGRCLPDVPPFCNPPPGNLPKILGMDGGGFHTPPTTDSSSPMAQPHLMMESNLSVNNDTLKSQGAWSSSNSPPPLQSAGSAINNAANQCTAIRVDRLKQAIAERRADDLAGFRREFASLNRKQDKPMEIGKAKMNAVRNRYKDIFPYDYNCVLLDDEQNAKEPIYVNASYIKGASGEREYVAAQGPSCATVGEFWKMIWQLQINRVVMLTNTHEKGKVKCYKYWPDVQECLVFDGISVETINEQVHAYYVRRTLRIRMRQLSERTETCSRMLTHFQFVNWPDHRVVRFATPVLQFLRKINKYSGSGGVAAAGGRRSSSDASSCLGPNGQNLILMHCSAGVGRTGTLIAADILIRRAEQALTRHSPHDVEVDVRSVVNALREQRHKMVQNLEQYMFVYDLVFESLTCLPVKPTAMPLTSLCLPISPERVQREFDTLEKTKLLIARNEFEVAMDLKNAGKNRVQRILPPSFCRVQLLTPSDDKQDYISAIWLDGVERTRSLIAAQSPMPHTVSDFWSVVWDWNVAAIVSLDPQPCLDPTYCPIGPSEEAEAVYHGCYKVKSLRRTAVSSRSNDDASRPYVVDVLSLTNSQRKSESCREVRHFTYTGAWLANARGVPASVEQFAEFVVGIDEARRVSHGKPVIVHCLDAATRSGLTLLSILLKEQCDCDDEVDVFNLCKLIRNFRPEFIPNQEQYAFAYNFVTHILGSECANS